MSRAELAKSQRSDASKIKKSSNQIRADNRGMLVIYSSHTIDTMESWLKQSIADELDRRGHDHRHLAGVISVASELDLVPEKAYIRADNTLSFFTSVNKHYNGANPLIER